MDGAYTRYMVTGVRLDDLLNALKEINPDMNTGEIKEEKNCISFEIGRKTPELMQTITEKLHCRGFADIGAWYGSAYFAAYDNGETYDGFTAGWTDGSPERREYDFINGEDIPDEDITWDAFVTVTDKETGAVFYTGDGAVSHDEMLAWQEFINRHKEEKYEHKK